MRYLGLFILLLVAGIAWCSAQPQVLGAVAESAQVGAGVDGHTPSPVHVELGCAMFLLRVAPPSVRRVSDGRLELVVVARDRAGTCLSPMVWVPERVGRPSVPLPASSVSLPLLI